MSQNPLLEVLDEPDSPWSGMLYVLRAEILRQLRLKKKIFLFTSSWEGEGKSSVIANLGASLAVMGKLVTIVDCDLRGPTLTRIFQKEAQSGLREAIENPDSLRTYETDVPGLIILPSGNMLGQMAAEIAASKNLGKILLSLAQPSDCVLVDSPPLSYCKDALLAGRWCDGAYMVLHQDKMQGYAEANFAEDLLENEIPVLGLVLNACRDIKVTQAQAPVRPKGWARLRGLTNSKGHPGGAEQ